MCTFVLARFVRGYPPLLSFFSFENVLTLAPPLLVWVPLCPSRYHGHRRNQCTDDCDRDSNRSLLARRPALARNDIAIAFSRRRLLRAHGIDGGRWQPGCHRCSEQCNEPWICHNFRVGWIPLERGKRASSPSSHYRRQVWVCCQHQWELVRRWISVLQLRSRSSIFVQQERHRILGLLANLGSRQFRGVWGRCHA